MNKYNIKKTFFLFFLVSVASCNEKKENIFETRIDNILYEKEIDSFELIKSTQEFIIGNVDTVLFGNEGTKISIKEGCFKSDSEIRIELVEYYHMSDFILQGLTTMTNEEIIETKGMVYLNILNEKNIDTDFTKIKISFPSLEEDLTYSPTDSIYKSFNGVVKNKEIVWIPVNLLEPRAILYKGDSICSYLYNNLFPIASFGWINCDKFIDYSNKCDLIVEVENDIPQMQYSLVFYSFNSILNGVKSKEKIEFTKIPSSEKVSMVGFGIVDEKLYYNILDLTTDTKGAKFPDLIPTTQEEFKRIIDNKFGDDLVSK